MWKQNIWDFEKLTFLPYIKFIAVHISKLNIMDLGVTALWICRVIRLYSCDLYLSLLLIFLHYYGYYYYECISSVCHKLEQRITPHWYHWEHLYNFVLLMKGECTLCPHYEKKLLSALSIYGLCLYPHVICIRTKITFIWEVFVQVCLAFTLPSRFYKANYMLYIYK